MTRFVRAALFAAALAIMPTAASADTLITPYVGWNWGGSSGAESTRVSFDTRTTYGGSVMWLGSMLGFEADFSTIPNFFEPKALEGADVFGSNGVTTLMGNLVVGGKGSGFRPYLAGGMGLLRQKVADFGDFVDVSRNSFGVNVGGGMLVGSRHFSVRGDVRYFRGLDDPEDVLRLDLSDFSFWRGTLGVSFGF